MRAPHAHHATLLPASPRLSRPMRRQVGGASRPGLNRHSQREAAGALYSCAMPIRIAVAEDNALLRDGLVRLISSVDDFELVGACSGYDELVALVDAETPDVVVTDIRMPPTGTDEGIRVATLLRTTHPQTAVVVLSQFASPAYALALLADGSERRAYLLKDRVADV